MMKSLILSTLFALLICNTIAHNHLIFPLPRNPQAFYIGNENCEAEKDDVPAGNVFKRGQSITPTWSYNNHHGGFVRFSIVPLGQENEGKPFNKQENILYYTCFGRSVGGPGTPLDEGDQIPCSATFQIPTYLNDGIYVLQWIMWSSYVADGREDRGLPNYTSCANIRIKGGTKTSEKPGQCSFFWLGGDTEYERKYAGKFKKETEEDTCAYFMRTNLGNSFDTVVFNDKFLLFNGRPDDVEECDKLGQLKRAPKIAAGKIKAKLNLLHGLQNGEYYTISNLAKVKTNKRQYTFLNGNADTKRVGLVATTKYPYIGTRWKVKINDEDNSISFLNQAGEFYLFGRPKDGSVWLVPDNGPKFTGARWQIEKLKDGSFTMKCLSVVPNPKHAFLNGQTVTGGINMIATGVSGARWAITPFKG